MDGLREFVAGGLGGSVGIFVCQPLDMVKVRLQSGRRATLSGIARTEGVRSLWKGLSVPLYTSALLNAVVFHSYGRALGYLLPEGADPASASLSAVFAAGCVSGAASSLITSPVDMLKIRAQVVVGGARGPVRSPCAMEIARRAIRSGGLPGLFNGLGATLLRDVPSYGAYFYLYEALRRAMVPEGGRGGAAEHLVAGGVAGALAWACIYPIDVVKTRVQAQDSSAGRRKGLLGCSRAIWREAGVKGFTRGLGSCLARAFALNSVIFVVYEETMKII